MELVTKDGQIYLNTNLEDVVPQKTANMISTSTIMMAFEPEEKYENPDGNPITFDTDFFGNHRDGGKVTPGPFIDSQEAQLPLF